MEKVIVFDTTLRDGEQSPGCRMDTRSKMLIAEQLECLGVNIIEAGFPIASDGDFEAVSQIAQVSSRATICALARTRPEDIERAAQALEKAERAPRIHTFVATSDVHIEKKLRKSPEEIIDMAVNSIVLAKRFVDDIEFSPEDASRTGLEFLIRIVEVAIEAGATTINVPDTVGYAVGAEYHDLILRIGKVARRKNSSTVISVHCHNDLNQAVANTLAGIRAGARQAECCVLGIGERAGNAQFEAVVMALKTRADYYGLEIDINTRELGNTARLVSSIIGKPISDNVPIVGGNVFAHGAGIHFDGVMKDHRTYEIMCPEEVGWKGESAPLIKHSGRHSLSKRLETLGYHLEEKILEAVYQKFVNLADTKTYVYNDDLYLLVQETLTERQARTGHLIVIERVDYHRVGDQLSATVTLSQNGDAFEASGSGDGPVSSTWNAIVNALKRQVTGITVPASLELKDFNVGKSAGGVEAVGLVTLRVESNGQTGYGRGSDTDIVRAFAKAQVAAINHLLQAPIEIQDS